MEREGLSLLDAQNFMTIATICADGSPQASTVAYVNERFAVYFLISRTSRKFRNITADGRVSIAVRSDASEPREIMALSMSARSFEARDEPCRLQMLSRLSERHPGYFDLEKLDFDRAVLFQAAPILISIIDFSLGLGHAEAVRAGGDGHVERIVGQADDRG